MDYAIEILNIELYKLKAIMFDHNKLMMIEPNANSEMIIIECTVKIEDIQLAVNLLIKNDIKQGN